MVEEKQHEEQMLRSGRSCPSKKTFPMSS